MFSAACPSCAGPVVYAHPAAVSAVCARCRSTVARTDRDLRVIGTAAPLGPEVSVLRVGARGSLAVGSGGRRRGFTLQGVLRKGRPGVRWTEWWLVFDDGETGWLSEGNGAWWLFALPARAVALHDEPHAGTEIDLDGERWHVVEAGEATLLAAEGSLPSAAVGARELRYADLRARDGAVGTLDLEESPPRLWKGVPTDLVALKMEGTRPVAGWSDESLVGFEGPSITGTRSLQCPGCAASLRLFTPAGAARRACEYCGALLDVDAEGDLAQAVLVQAAEGAFAAAGIPLGTRGTLDGIAWQVNGSILRYVRSDFMDYEWEELLLWNPWHGYRWLVRGTDGHWNFVRPGSPAGNRHSESLVRDGVTFRRFSRGTSRVRRVLGEFWWSLAAGDQVEGIDWIAPPRMISVEVAGNEEAWSEAHWIDAADVARAFGVELRASRTVGATQPNPWDTAAFRRVAGAALVTSLVTCCGLCGVAEGGWIAGKQVVDAGVQAEGGALRAPLTVAGELLGRHALEVRYALSEGAPFEGPAEARFVVRHADGRTWNASADLCDAPEATAHFQVPSGSYTVEAELTPAAAHAEASGRAQRLTVLDRRGFGLPVLGLVAPPLALLGALWILFSRYGFERQRWENAG